MKVVGIIPARFGSTRFPGKPLTDILGKTMIRRVYEQVKKAHLVDYVAVATDDQRIYDEVKFFGGDAKMTSADAANGTVRVAEVARDLSCDYVVNIQGDEPVIDPKVIDHLINVMLNNPSIPVGTLVKKITDSRILNNPNIPKVVLNNNNEALYFSRSPIPFFRDEKSKRKWTNEADYYQHIGIYIYQREFLLKLVDLKETSLERIEQLEQLRVLGHGYKIKVAITETEQIGVDVPEDVEKVITYLKGKGIE